MVINCYTQNSNNGTEIQYYAKQHHCKIIYIIHLKSSYLSIHSILRLMVAAAQIRTRYLRKDQGII